MGPNLVTPASGGPNCRNWTGSRCSPRHLLFRTALGRCSADSGRCGARFGHRSCHMVGDLGSCQLRREQSLDAANSKLDIEHTLGNWERATRQRFPPKEDSRSLRSTCLNGRLLPTKSGHSKRGSAAGSLCSASVRILGSECRRSRYYFR